MTFTFSEGDPKTISVPVVSQCGAYVDVVAAADETKKPAKKGKNAGNQASEGAAAGGEGAAGEGTEEASTLPADAPTESEQAESDHAESEQAESEQAGGEHAESGHASTEDPYSCEFPEAALPGAEEGH